MDETQVMSHPAGFAGDASPLADRFTILRVIGDGAAGAVYKVHDRQRPGLTLALKVLTNKTAFDDKTTERFLQEWRLCQKLTHPNLVQAYELFEFKDTLAFSMEYVEGSDLGRDFEELHLSEAQIEKIFDQLLSALDKLHQQGIVHRDVKLENILLRPDGTIKLADLGLVKQLYASDLTRKGLLLGTVQYFPPEYLRRGTYDARGDIYAAGLAMFELLTGERRLSNVPEQKIVQHLLKTRFAIPWNKLRGHAARYRPLLERALDPQPAQRFQSAAEMRAALRNPSSTPATEQSKAEGTSKRRRALLAAAAGLLFAAAGALLLMSK